MDEELKKEKEKLKERESQRRKSVGITKNINPKEKDDLMKQNFNPIRIKVRKQTLI